MDFEFERGVERRREQVGERRVVTGHAEAVRHAGGQEDRFAVIGAQVNDLDRSEGRRADPHFNDDVVDLSEDAGHHLRLTLRRERIVKTSHDVARRHREVRLLREERGPRRLDVVGREPLSKESPFVAPDRRLQHEEVGNGEFVELHDARSFNGRHHSSLSRYHWTVAASPSSNPTWGS